MRTFGRAHPKAFPRLSRSPARPGGELRRRLVRGGSPDPPQRRPRLGSCRGPAPVRRALAPPHRARPAPHHRLRGRPRAVAPHRRRRPPGHAHADRILLRAGAALPDGSGRAYRPGALGLSSSSPVLTGWTRGRPIAIHGTNRADTVGAAVSNGCSACATSRCSACCAMSPPARRSRSSPDERAGPSTLGRHAQAERLQHDLEGSGGHAGQLAVELERRCAIRLDVHTPRAQDRDLAVPEVHAAVEPREVERQVELAHVAPDEHVEPAVVGLGLRQMRIPPPNARPLAQITLLATSSRGGWSSTCTRNETLRQAANVATVGTGTRACLPGAWTCAPRARRRRRSARTSQC